jgi:hypothetical protein
MATLCTSDFKSVKSTRVVGAPARTSGESWTRAYAKRYRHSSLTLAVSPSWQKLQSFLTHEARQQKSRVSVSAPLLTHGAGTRAGTRALAQPQSQENKLKAPLAWPLRNEAALTSRGQTASRRAQL